MNAAAEEPGHPGDNTGMKRSSPVRRLIPALLLTAVATQAPAETTYSDVAPILAANCTICHSGDSAAAGLRLDSLDAIIKGSTRGAVVKPGAPADSEILRRIKGSSQPRMPMTGPPYLSDKDIGTIEQWVAGGLREGDAVTDAAAPQAIQHPPADTPLNYQHVAPIFARRCARCHSDNGQMGRAPEGFRLTSYAETLSASDRVRVIPGNAAASELVRRIRGQSRPRMPFDGPPYLDDDEIRLVEEWIAQGARNAAGEPASIPVGARVRLHGVLESRWKLDGIDLIVGPGTRIDKNPRPGDYVQVRGSIDQAGRIQVERLRRR